MPLPPPQTVHGAIGATPRVPLLPVPVSSVSTCHTLRQLVIGGDPMTPASTSAPTHPPPVDAAADLSSLDKLLQRHNCSRCSFVVVSPAQSPPKGAKERSKAPPPPDKLPDLPGSPIKKTGPADRRGSRKLPAPGAAKSPGLLSRRATFCPNGDEPSVPDQPQRRGTIGAVSFSAERVAAPKAQDLGLPEGVHGHGLQMYLGRSSSMSMARPPAGLAGSPTGGAGARRCASSMELHAVEDRDGGAGLPPLSPALLQGRPLVPAPEFTAVWPRQ